MGQCHVALLVDRGVADGVRHIAGGPRHPSRACSAHLELHFQRKRFGGRGIFKLEVCCMQRLNLLGEAKLTIKIYLICRLYILGYLYVI